MDENTVETVLDELTDEQVLEQLGDDAPAYTDDVDEPDDQIDMELDDERVEPADETVDIWADRDYRLVDDKGEPLSQVQDMSLAELLEGNIKLEYTASGEAKVMPLDKLVDWATRLPGTSRAAQEARERVKSLDSELAKYADLETKNAQNETLLRRILRGDNETLAKAREAYEKGLGEDFMPPKAEPEPEAGQFSAEEQAAGQRLAVEVIEPHAKALAEAFDVPMEDVAQEIAQMIFEEGKHLTWGSVNEILNSRVIDRLEEAGYEAKSRWSRFDTDAYEQQAASGAQTKTVGIKPKGATREMSADDKLKAENEKLRAELAEARVSSAGDVEPTSGSANDKRSRKSNPKYKSDLIDLSEAESVDDIMKQLDAMEEKFG